MVLLGTTYVWYVVYIFLLIHNFISGKLYMKRKDLMTEEDLKEYHAIKDELESLKKQALDSGATKSILASMFVVIVVFYPFIKLYFWITGKRLT